ncbi:SpoIID/LytB domain-containing protein [Anaerosphaera multitolerans]|uniref:SpoIID/LytB domain-containing protein n=1 Tax=Anaerosphaera multitolerans TaxID=2487351 RepID=A0A437S869_9FIRM|nr:SpoIID/LytB domain-containing protein [Anaerosphaera multitolerans]RVU55280.1 SpoIID/LytB domain-containing protein [Anaerosphaera multitolerans]
MKKIFFLALIAISLILPIKNYAQEGQTYLDVKIGKSYGENEVVSIVSTKNIYLVDADYNKVLDLNTSSVDVTLKEGKIELKGQSQTHSTDFPQDGSMLLATDGYLKLKNEYRGYISFRVVENKLLVINSLELEDYLKGVVPRELSPSYPIEALKAQAICSRSFALKNINKYEKYGYNLDDTTNCQAYEGKTIENEKTNQAVDETKGIYALYNGKIANTIYGASSGGVTANADDVWSGDAVEYLKTLEDPYSNNYTWEHKLSVEEVNKAIKSASHEIGDFLNFNIKEIDSSGRIKTIELIGTENTVAVTGNNFRNIFGNMKLKSTLFNITIEDDQVIFKGKGFGHGVGMSQLGAVEMAKTGKTANDIISFYFPGVILNK